jgi:hypothetical protein
VFLQHRCIGLFEANRAYLHLQNYDLQEEFLSVSKSTITGNNVLDADASNTDAFLSRDTCVS